MRRARLAFFIVFFLFTLIGHAESCLGGNARTLNNLQTKSPDLFAIFKPYMQTANYKYNIEAQKNNLFFFYDAVRHKDWTKSQLAQALDAAINNDRTAIAIYLLESGAPLNGLDSKNLPLLAAIKCRNKALTYYLLRRGANPNVSVVISKSQHLYVSPFTIALISHQWLIVKQLLEYGYNICADRPALEGFSKYGPIKSQPNFVRRAFANNLSCLTRSSTRK